MTFRVTSQYSAAQYSDLKNKFSLKSDFRVKNIRDWFKSFQCWSLELKTPFEAIKVFRVEIFSSLTFWMAFRKAEAKISACSSDSASIISRLARSGVAISILVGLYFGFFGLYLGCQYRNITNRPKDSNL